MDLDVVGSNPITRPTFSLALKARPYSERESIVVIHEATFDALVGMVPSNPEWKSWTMAKELRKLGFAVPRRHDLQKVRSTLRKTFKKK